MTNVVKKVYSKPTLVKLEKLSTAPKAISQAPV